MELHTNTAGNGFPCYLLPANGHESRDYDAVRPTLARHFETIAVDWPAMGEAAALPSPQETSALTLAELLEASILARPDDTPVTLIGHSVGGFAAGRFAIRHPQRVRALVLVSSGGFVDIGPFGRTFCRVKGTPAVIRRVEGAFARWHTKARNTATLEMLARIDTARQRAEYAATVAAIWTSFATDSYQLHRIGQVSSPTLLVWGKRDPIVPLSSVGRPTQRAVPGSRLITLNTGHSPFVEDPEGFLTQALPFLLDPKAESDTHQAAS